MDELIVNVALTGGVHHQRDNPALPVTPLEIAVDARCCADAGATMFHLHVRDDRGNPTWPAWYWQLLILAVRETVPGAVLVASCSGRHYPLFHERAAALHSPELPDLASLSVSSFNFRGEANVNNPAMVSALALRMAEKGVLPEVEVFDLGHAIRAREMVDAGEIPVQTWWNLFAGVVRTWHLDTLLSWVPTGALFAYAGLGRFQWLATKRSIEIGGHVRVGLEDSLWMDEGDPATNPRMVERVVAYGREWGREPATFEQTREALGL